MTWEDERKQSEQDAIDAYNKQQEGYRENNENYLMGREDEDAGESARVI